MTQTHRPGKRTLNSIRDVGPENDITIDCSRHQLRARICEGEFAKRLVEEDAWRCATLCLRKYYNYDFGLGGVAEGNLSYLLIDSDLLAVSRCWASSQGFA